MSGLKREVKAEPGASGGGGGTQELLVRVAATSPEKTFNLMKFRREQKVEAAEWESGELVREDNRRVFEQSRNEPEFGAGSEFGRAAREDARRKRRGFQARRYAHHKQPWQLTTPSGKRFRGMKEGGAGDNADHWAFVKAPDGSFTAHKVSDWYNFLPVATHKTLDIDQAEEQFKTRAKVLNTFALKAKLQGMEQDEDSKDGQEGGAKPAPKSGAFKITDKDEFSSDSDSDDLVDVKEAQDSDDDGKKKKKSTTKKGAKPTKGKKKKAKEKKVVVAEGEEVASGESSDGAEEGREVADYETDSGSEDEDGARDADALAAKAEEELVGVDAEKGLRTLLSDQEDEEDSPAKLPGGQDANRKEKGSDSDSPSEDSDDPDASQLRSAVFLQEKTLLSAEDASSIGKRPSASASSEGPSAKRPRQDSMEAEVIKYLEREKMNTKQLINKLKPKGAKALTKEAKSELIARLADVLKRLGEEFGPKFHRTQVDDKGKKTWYFQIRP